jgi:hypothetical protein
MGLVGVKRAPPAVGLVRGNSWRSILSPPLSVCACTGAAASNGANAIGAGPGRRSPILSPSSLIFSTVLQIVTELLVDGACLHFERIMELLSDRRALNERKFVSVFLLASWNGPRTRGQGEASHHHR